MVYSPSAGPVASAPTASPLLSALPGVGESLSITSLTGTVLVSIVTLLLIEQAFWRWRKGSLPGAKWQIPIIGQFAESLNPTMEAYKRSWANPLAAVSVFNIFIVIASKRDYSRKILNSQSYTEPCLVRSAKQILLPENWVFLNGKMHNEYRKGLNVLFTRQALSIYLQMQSRIYKDHFAQWLADPTPSAQEYQLKFRDLNMETSLRVFCGDYITGAEAKEVSDKYWQITNALELVNFPFAFPGTKVWKACKCREITVKYLSKAAAASKKAIAAGKEPNCLLDAWVEEIFAAKAHREGDAERPSLMMREFSDHEMALVLLSFIFASQDAMSSSITFGFQFLADYPEVFAKVRAEQDKLRSHDPDAPLTLDLLDEMTYTQAVVRETLRYRPPVIMVPYTAKENFPITDDYTVPKGSMVIPSFWNALHDPEVYPEPDEFKPERWLPGGANHNVDDSRSWLVFGAGAHRCIAQSYVNMHMTATLGTAAMTMDWTHERTPESDDIKIIATIFPKDGCRLKFTKRQQ